MSLIERFINIAKLQIQHHFDPVSQTDKKKIKKEGKEEKEEKEEVINKGIKTEIERDLEVFNLNPPSSWKEVRKRRNDLIKKYHSDLYSSNPEKEKIAKEITQIYNDTYDRLKKHFGKK